MHETTQALLYALREMVNGLNRGTSDAYDRAEMAWQDAVCPDADPPAEDGWVEAEGTVIVGENGFAFGSLSDTTEAAGGGRYHQVKVRVRLPLPPAPPEVVAEVVTDG